MTLRASIGQFELANPLYRNASISFYTVAAGVKTATLATLYAATTGTAQLANPQKLNSRGQFKQPVYISAQVIGVIEGISVPTHDTAIISVLPEFRVKQSDGSLQYSYDLGVSWSDTGDFIFANRGEWVTAADYRRNDIVTHSGYVYLGLSAHTAGVFATDLAASLWIQVLDLTTFSVSGGSSLIGFIQSGVGATLMTAQTEMRHHVSPKQFGAIGDGVADDTAAISAMLESRKTISAVFDGMGGTFKITATITKALSAGVSWELRDFNFVSTGLADPVAEQGLLKFTGDEVAGSPWAGTNKIKLENVTFVHANALASVGFLDGIQILNFDQVLLTNVRATGYTNTGVMLELCRQVLVQNCDCSTNLYAGLRGSNIYQCAVLGGTYNNNGILIPAYGYGVAFSAGDRVNSNINLLIQGITANGNQRKAIDFHAGIHVHVCNNNISGFGQCGIYALADTNGDITRDVIISGNIVEADATLAAGSSGIAIGANGVLASSAGQYMVINNIIKDCKTAGSWAIEIDANSTVFAPDLVLVSGNRILTSGSSTTAPIAVRGTNLIIGNVKINDNYIYTTAAKYGIDIQNATNTMIDGNSIEVTGGVVTCGINFIDSVTRPVHINGNKMLGTDYTAYITDASDTLSANMITNNTGKGVALKSVYPTGICIDFGAAIPAAGDGWYTNGSVRWNTAVAAGGAPGWVCTTSGITGGASVWKAMANVAA